MTYKVELQSSPRDVCTVCMYLMYVSSNNLLYDTSSLR